MLEKPNIANKTIISCLHGTFGLEIAQLNFLPIGADQHTAVYRAIDKNSTAYFIKLRSGHFEETTITVPKYLYDEGMKYVVPPIATKTGQLWVDVADYKLAVFPFVDGYNGYEGDLKDDHWIAFGRALYALHSTRLPANLASPIHRETFSDYWRKHAQGFMAQTTFIDDIASELGAFLKQKESTIHELLNQAEKLAAALKAQSEPFVLCHADSHAGNVLIDAQGDFYIVDWDTLILAPKERDLMYVGGGQFLNKRSVAKEKHLFYQGYGQTDVNPAGISYYLCERIVEDIAAYGEQIMVSTAGGEDRINGLHQLMSQFDAGGVVDIALQST